MHIATAAEHLQALGNPVRLRIYQVLAQAGDDGLTVGRVQSVLKINASTLSHHLKTMVVAGLVTQTRESTNLICRTNRDAMHGLFRYLTLKCAADRAA